MFINVYNFDFVFRNAKDGNYHVLALLRNIWKLRPQSYKFYKYVFILLHASANMKCDIDSIILRLITQQQKCTENILQYMKCLFAVPGTHYSTTISYQVVSFFFFNSTLS